MPQTVASDLCLHCLSMSHKKGTRLIWVNISTLPETESNELVYAEYDHPYCSFYCIILIELDPLFLVSFFLKVKFTNYFLSGKQRLFSQIKSCRP